MHCTLSKIILQASECGYYTIASPSALTSYKIFKLKTFIQSRRRRMHGVVRLQEVPLSMQDSSTDGKFAAAINAKTFDQEQQPVQLWKEHQNAVFGCLALCILLRCLNFVRDTCTALTMYCDYMQLAFVAIRCTLAKIWLLSAWLFACCMAGIPHCRCVCVLRDKLNDWLPH